MGLINFSETLDILSRIFEDKSSLLSDRKNSQFCVSTFFCAIFDNSKKKIELIELENYFNKTKFKIDNIKNSIFKKMRENFNSEYLDEKYFRDKTVNEIKNIFVSYLNGQ